MRSKKLMRVLAGLVSGAMIMSLCACGGSGGQKAAPAETAAKTEAKAEAGADAGKAEGGKAENGETTAAAGDAKADAAAPASDFKFDHRIEIMVPAGEGGGLDTTIRKFATYLEKELGTSIVISNRSGASGITGYTWSHNQPADGYKYQFTAPSAIIAAAQGQCDFDLLNEIVPVSGLVMAEGMFFASPKVPFKDVNEMIDYCKANPGKVTIATDSPNGISGAIITEFCNQAGIELKWITSESNEGTISVIAGDVDLAINTWSDAGAYVESGDLIPIVVMSQQRSTIYPDVPCSGDLGYTSDLGFYRVFTAMKGTPQEAVDAFAAAVHKVATTNTEWAEWLEMNGMSNTFVWDAAELNDVIKTTYDTAVELNKK